MVYQQYSNQNKKFIFILVDWDNSVHYNIGLPAHQKRLGFRFFICFFNLEIIEVSDFHSLVRKIKLEIIENTDLHILI